MSRIVTPINRKSLDSMKILLFDLAFDALDGGYDYRAAAKAVRRRGEKMARRSDFYLQWMDRAMDSETLKSDLLERLVLSVETVLDRRPKLAREIFAQTLDMYSDMPSLRDDLPELAVEEARMAIGWN